MNTQTSNYFKVGLLTALAIGAIAVIFVFLLGSLQHGKTYTAVFDDAHGIRDKEIVRMSGVDIGQVGNVHLTPENKAEMNVEINKGIHVPLGSKFTISNSILGNQSILVIIPSNSPQDLPDGATVTGDSSDPMTQMMAGAGQTLQTVQQTLIKSQALVEKLTESASLLNDPKRIRKIDALLDNMDATTAGLPRIENKLEAKVEHDLDDVSAETHELLAGLNETRGSAEKVIDGAGKLTNGMNDTLAENRKTIKSLLRNSNDISDSLASILGQVRASVGDTKIHDALSGASKNMQAVTINLESISTRLDATVSDVQRLADDPRLNADIRETVSNLRASSESIHSLLNRVETIHIPGEHRAPAADDTSAPATPAPTHYFSSTSLLEPGLVFDTTYDRTIERLRFDADYTLLHGQPGAFYRAGLYDATYSDRLNLEAGQGLFGNRFDYRYGLIAGKLGAGFDLRASFLDFRLDGYDPNHGTLNARAKANINANTSIMAGFDSIGRGNEATLGVQIRK